MSQVPPKQILPLTAARLSNTLQNTSTQSQHHCSSGRAALLLRPQFPLTPRTSSGYISRWLRKQCTVPFPSQATTPASDPKHPQTPPLALKCKRLILLPNHPASFSSSFGRCLNVKLLCFQYLAEPGPRSWRVFGGCVIS